MPPLFVSVDFVVMCVSADALMETCGAKSNVYINARDLHSPVIGLSTGSGGLRQF